MLYSNKNIPIKFSNFSKTHKSPQECWLFVCNRLHLPKEVQVYLFCGRRGQLKHCFYCPAFHLYYLLAIQTCRTVELSTATTIIICGSHGKRWPLTSPIGVSCKDTGESRISRPVLLIYPKGPVNKREPATEWPQSKHINLVQFCWRKAWNGSHLKYFYWFVLSYLTSTLPPCHGDNKCAHKWGMCKYR